MAPVKGLSPEDHLAGEEWLAGPATTARNIRLLIEALEQGAKHVGVDINELPEVGSWGLPGYFPNPALPPERQLSRAKELLQSKGKR